jgi:predicted transcriptional regulator of viral defense system
MAVAYFTTRDWVALLSALPPTGACLNVSSLRTLTGLSEKAVRQACWRLSRSGLLRRLGRGWYANSFHPPLLEEIGSLLVAPSYLSLDWVLSAARITTQPCYVLTCATTRPTARRETAWGPIEYRSISEDLFWGFRPRITPHGFTILEAEPEKAVLDLLYLSRKTGEPVWIDIELGFLDAGRLAAYAGRFPRSTQRALETLHKTH